MHPRGAVEAREQARQLRTRDPDAPIGNGNFDLAEAPLDRDADPLAGRAVLQRVPDQVGEHLFDPLLLPPTNRRRVDRRHLDPCTLLRTEARQDGGQARFEVTERRPWHEGASLDPRGVEQVIQQPGHRQRLGPNHGQPPGHLSAI